MENKDKIINKAFIELEFCDKTVVFESNQVETKPVKVKIEKMHDCEFVVVGHDIKYTIIIENECKTELFDILFKDKLDECTKYVEHSFKVNGISKTPILGDTLEYVIEKLEGKEKITITFEVKVMDCACDEKNPEPKPEPKSNQPTVRSIDEDDSRISGTGITGSLITVDFPDGKYATTTVSGGNWNVNVPSGVKIKKGNIIYVTQTETGKSPSDKVSITVDNSSRRD